MNRVFYFAPLLLVFAFMQGSSLAQTFDTSGDGLLKGTWYVRQTAFDNLTSSGTAGRARSITGTVAFDGNGSYTLTAQISDNTVSSGTPKSLSITGSYQVSSSGLLELQNPLDTTQTIFGGVGASAFVASSTEGSIIDMMVGVPVGTSVSASSLQGQYWVGSLEYPGGDVTQSKNALFQLNADGKGGLGTLSVSGHSVALSNSDVTQSVTGGTYTLTGTSGTLIFPLTSGSTAQSQLINGTKQFFVGSDGNILVGGAANGYDMIIGVRAATGSVGNATFNGNYYAAGADADVSTASTGSYYLDSYYGSLHANGAGTVLVHQRINPSDSPPYDYTADDEFSVGSNGGVTENYAQFYVGAGGNATILIGRSTTYSIELTVTAKTTAPTGSVVLNPLGVVNTATYAPITNPVAPGEFLDLFGTGLAPSSQQAQSLPLPSSLGGVSVSINGLPAPVYIVSPTEIVCIVPYGITQTYATIQVTNNGTKSNAVTLYTEQSAPGAFTLGQNGIGPGAFLHPNGTVVSDSNPAKVGETIAAYLTGLGAVAPSVSDGAAAPSSPLSTTSDQINVFVDGTQATVTFAGLAPGFAGLYQVNFTVPSTPDTGQVYVDFEDIDYGGYTSMSTMAVSNVQASLANPALKTAGHRLARVVRRETTCQENFGAANATPTQANCSSVGKTRTVSPSTRRRNAGIFRSGE